MIEFYISNGSKTLMLTAGDSHYVCLREDEIGEITRFVVAQVNGRAMVITADRYFDTSHAVEFAEYAAKLGADLLMVMPPGLGGSTTSQTLMEHYASVSTKMPVMLVTNVFIQRGIPFGLATLEKCLNIENIVAIKDDFCGIFSRKMSLLVHDSWAVISGGQKQNHLNNHPNGCDGYSWCPGNFRPG